MSAFDRAAISAEATSLDAGLMRRLADGDAAALGPLYDRYGGPAYSLANRLLRDAAMAEDAVQECFLALWRHARSFDAARGGVRPWLLTSVHHRCISILRGRRPDRDIPLDLGAELPAADDVWGCVSRALDAAAVRRGMAQLSEEQRDVVRLAYYGGLTHLQIAAQQGVPLGTVKGRLRLAMQKLRDALAAEFAPRGTGGG